jgi:hypothetical protein
LIIKGDEIKVMPSKGNEDLSHLNLSPALRNERQISEGHKVISAVQAV